MKTIINKIDEYTKAKRIYFLYPKEDNRPSYFSADVKKRVRLEHNANKDRNKVAFQEDRVELATYLVKSMVENPPSWGSFKFREIKYK